MRLAIYARVSTKDQTVDPQLDALRRYAQARGAEVAEFTDQGLSGATAKRPALEALRAACRKREVDAVAIVKLDRLFRSLQHLMEIGAEWSALGVDLIVLDQAIDTTTPAGRLMFNMLGSVAEFERDLIRERTLAGVAAARRRGARMGRPRALDDEKLARARRMAAAGQSARHIARVLEVAPSTILAALAC